MARYRLSPLSIRETSTTAIPVSSATVTVYLAGTSTLATCYANTTTSTALTGSQTTTNSYGYFEFYVDGKDYKLSQKFKIVITKTGYPDVTYDNLSIILPIEKEVDVREFLPSGFATDGSVDYSVELQAAFDYAKNNDLPVYLHDIYGTTAKLTVVRPLNDTEGITIYGRGRGISGLKYMGVASIGTLLDIDGTSSGYSLNNHFHGFKLDLTDAPAGTIGLKINAGVWRSRFENLYITRNVPGGGRTGTGIYMGSATPGDVGCFDNKFNYLYVNNFSKNLHFQGTDLSGNTITNCPIDHSYIANGDYNLYAEFFNGLSANNTQYENAQTAGAYFANGETYVHIGGTIESPAAAAKGIDMDANTKSVIAFCDFYNNAGGNFNHNGKIGHFWKSTNSGIVVPSGGELRIDRDASYTGYIRFFKNGVADVRLNVAASGDAMTITDSVGNEIFKFDVTNNRFSVTNGSVLMPNGSGTPGIYSYNGSPENNVTANAGSICLDSTGGAGTSLYVKESGSGNTGWVAK